MAKVTWDRDQSKEGVKTGGGILLTPFLIMILLGAIHSAYNQVPALGFKVTWFICMILLLAGRYFSGE